MNDQSGDGTTPQSPESNEPKIDVAKDVNAVSLTSNETVTTLPQPIAPSKNILTRFKNGNIKKLGLLVGAGVLLIGASAAGYFGYVVPNQPDNVLIESFANLAKQKQITLDADVGYRSKTDNLAVALKAKMQTNTETNQFATDGTLGISGSQFRFDLRFIDESIYFKVAGLSGLAEILGGSLDQSGLGSIAPLIDQVDDQWYVADQTVTSFLGEECSTEVSLALSEQDIVLLTNAYEKHPLFSVKSSAKETVDGVETTKFVVDPASSQEAASFVNEIENLSIIKQAKACAGGEETQLDEEVKNLPTEDAVAGAEIAFYVTDEKQMKKISIVGEDETARMEFSGVFSFDQVSISAPEGARPVQDLLGSLLGGSLGDIQAAAGDVERKTDLLTARSLLEAYYNEFGVYPLESELESAGIVSTYLTGPDGDEYTYTSDGSSFTLSAQLEDPTDPDAENGLYIIRSLN